MEGRAFRHGDIVRFSLQAKHIMFPTPDLGRHAVPTGQEVRWICSWRTYREGGYKVWWIRYQTRILWVRVPIFLPPGKLTPHLGTGSETIVKFVVYPRPSNALLTDYRDARLWI